MHIIGHSSNIMDPFHSEFRPGHEMKTTRAVCYLHQVLNPRSSAFLVLLELLAVFNTMTIHGILVDHSYLPGVDLMFLPSLRGYFQLCWGIGG